VIGQHHDRGAADPVGQVSAEGRGVDLAGVLVDEASLLIEQAASLMQHVGNHPERAEHRDVERMVVHDDAGAGATAMQLSVDVNGGSDVPPPVCDRPSPSTTQMSEAATSSHHRLQGFTRIRPPGSATVMWPAICSPQPSAARMRSAPASRWLASSSLPTGGMTRGTQSAALAGDSNSGGNGHCDTHLLSDAFFGRLSPHLET
jgi:hypothetical protein